MDLVLRQPLRLTLRLIHLRFSRSVIPGTDKFFTHLYSGTTSPVYVYDAGLLPNASTDANRQSLIDFYDSGQLGHGGARNAYIASADGISDMCFGGNAIGIGTRIETVVGVANTAIAGSLNFVLPPLDYPQAATTPAGAVCAITTSYCTGYQFGNQYLQVFVILKLLLLVYHRLQCLLVL